MAPTANPIGNEGLNTLKINCIYIRLCDKNSSTHPWKEHRERMADGRAQIILCSGCF